MSAGSPCTIVTSTSETRRTSASPIVTRVLTSDSIRTSRGPAVGPVSRDDHQTCVADPGDTAASTIVRPAADVRRSTSPGDTRRSDCSPGTSNVAVALPAGGTGRTKDPRPGLEVIAEPHSSVAENVEGPDRTATCELPSATSGSGRSAMRASSSVALAINGTFTVPAWNTSPSTVIVARTALPAMRARMSVRVRAAATGAPSGGRGCRVARSRSRS